MNNSALSYPGFATSENIVRKVKVLIKDGLKIVGVELEKVECKNNSNLNKPCVPIAKFKLHKDKRKVMLKKRLGDTHQYKNLFINHDTSMKEKRMSDNFCVVVSFLKR